MDKRWLIILVVGLGIIAVAILAMTNNVFLVLAIIAVILAVYFYLQYKALSSEPMPPYTMLKNRIIRAISQCNPRTLGYLILRGDSDFQRCTLGKMVGVIEWNLEPSEEDKKKLKDGTIDKGKLFPKGWDKVVIIGYKTKHGGMWDWPILSSFVPVELFAAARHQLWDAPGLGDLRIKGVSIEPVYLFWMTNAVDLDKDYIAHAIKSEVHRITLEQYFDKLPSMIDNAVKSDGFQLKVKELMMDKKKSTGIVT